MDLVCWHAMLAVEVDGPEHQIEPGQPLELAGDGHDVIAVGRRAVYAGALAHLVAMPQTLSTELQDTGIQVQALASGVEDDHLLQPVFKWRGVPALPRQA